MPNIKFKGTYIACTFAAKKSLRFSAFHFVHFCFCFYSNKHRVAVFGQYFALNIRCFDFVSILFHVFCNVITFFFIWFYYFIVLTRFFVVAFNIVLLNMQILRIHKIYINKKTHTQKSQSATTLLSSNSRNGMLNAKASPESQRKYSYISAQKTQLVNFLLNRMNINQ